MDLVTDSLTTQLTDNPMLLLEIPESIFELFESDKPIGHEECQPPLDMGWGISDF